MHEAPLSFLEHQSKLYQRVVELEARIEALEYSCLPFDMLLSRQKRITAYVAVQLWFTRNKTIRAAQLYIECNGMISPEAIRQIIHRLYKRGELAHAQAPGTYKKATLP